MAKFVTLSIDRLNQVIGALNSYCNTGEIDCADDLVAELLAERDQKQNEQEPVGYEYVEHRPYGAPGEIRRGTILLEHYRNADGAIAGDWEWLVQQFKTSKNTISMRPLYTHPQPKCEPLTDGQIDAIADAMPGGLEGFLKGWGWRQFARAVLESANSTK